MFYAAARELNGGEDSQVHFGFASLSGAAPQALPPGFANYVEYSIASPSSAQPTALQSYDRSHDIGLVMLLDVQPLSPLARLHGRTPKGEEWAVWPGSALEGEFTREAQRRRMMGLQTETHPPPGGGAPISRLGTGYGTGRREPALTPTLIA